MHVPQHKCEQHNGVDAHHHHHHHAVGGLDSQGPPHCGRDGRARSNAGRACAAEVPHGCTTAGWRWTSTAAPFEPRPCQLEAGAAPDSHQPGAFPHATRGTSERQRSPRRACWSGEETACCMHRFDSKIKTGRTHALSKDKTPMRGPCPFACNPVSVQILLSAATSSRCWTAASRCWTA